MFVPPVHDNELVFVSNAVANGGAGRVLVELANHFARAGSRVGVIVYRPDDKEYPTHPDIQRSYAPATEGIVGKLRTMSWLRQTARANPQATFIAFEYFVNMQTLIALFGLRNHVIVSERNDPARVGSGGVVGWLRPILYRRADLVVFQTQDAADYLSDRISKRIILNPLTPDLPDPVDGTRRHRIVSFGRLEPQKNLTMLLDAFSLFLRDHPSYSLELIGDGSERDRLAEHTRALGIEESVAILPARLDIHDHIRDAAMFVLPSDYEGLSNSMLEAMAMGIPTICTDAPCGGARTVIIDGINGVLTPVGDAGALLDAMQRVASSEEFQQSLSTNSRQLRDRLSIDSIASEWRDAVASAH